MRISPGRYLPVLGVYLALACSSDAPRDVLIDAEVRDPPSCMTLNPEVAEDYGFQRGRVEGSGGLDDPKIEVIHEIAGEEWARAQGIIAAGCITDVTERNYILAEMAASSATRLMTMAALTWLEPEGQDTLRD